MTRKSPVRHKVKSHTRQGRPVKSFTRGKGRRLHNPNNLGQRRRLVKRVKIVGVNGQEARINDEVVGTMNADYGVFDKETQKYFAEKGYRFTPKTATMESIGVEEAERGRGIGGQLLEFWVQEAKKRGMDRAIIWHVRNPGFFLLKGFYAVDEGSSIMVKDFTGKPWKQVIKETITYDTEKKDDYEKRHNLVRAADGFIVKDKKYPKKVLEYARSKTKSIPQDKRTEIVREMTLKEAEEWLS